MIDASSCVICFIMDHLSMRYDPMTMKTAEDIKDKDDFRFVPANERHLYFVTTSLIGWAQT